MRLSRGVKGCIGKYLAVELLMKCVWQFGGDTCLFLPILGTLKLLNWQRHKSYHPEQ